MQRTAIRVDGARLVQRLGDLASIGAIHGTAGAARLALTDADRAGRNLVTSWMHDLAMDVRIDEIGNVVGVWGAVGAAAGRAPVMTGSHIDTVRTGGRYDGNYGVLAGLEIVETLATAGFVPQRPIAVAFFTGEEGARFAPDMVGSLVYVGGMSVETARDIVATDGALLGRELDRIGYAGAWPCPAVVPHAFVEVHIEQGPVLEAEGDTIGAVTGVQGISWQEVMITGQSNHAGTTPMALRHDAGYAAARLATGVRDIAQQLGPPQVGTVGSIDLHPDVINVVAASARITVDLRNTDDAVLREAERRFRTLCDEVATAEGVHISARSLARFEPVTFDPRIVELIETVAIAEGQRVRRMPSGAGHDAQMLARLCPTGMIFVPSVGGLSHNPAEHTDAGDLEAGANILLQTLLALADADLDAPPLGGQAAATPASRPNRKHAE